jgi:hypothetical protein
MGSKARGDNRRYWVKIGVTHAPMVSDLIASAPVLPLSTSAWLGGTMGHHFHASGQTTS